MRHIDRALTESAPYLQMTSFILLLPIKADWWQYASSRPGRVAFWRTSRRHWPEYVRIDVRHYRACRLRIADWRQCDITSSTASATARVRAMPMRLADIVKAPESLALWRPVNW